MLKLTQTQINKLLENGAEANKDCDHVPVAKLFTPDANATWLLTEIDPLAPTHAFGLCDLGHGFPELGYVSLLELSVLRGAFGLSVERDEDFESSYPLSIYAEAARNVGYIVTDERILSDIDQKRKTPQTLKAAAPRPI